MKNYSIVLNVVLFIAVVVLYVLHFTGNHNNASTEQVNVGGGAVAGTKVVYVNTDTLLNNYLLSVELNEAFLKKQEARRTELNMKAKEFDQQAGEFQRKLENGGFISMERAEAARQELINKQQNLQRLQQDMTEKMMKEQADLNKQLFENITSFLDEYNKEKGYNIVLSTVLAGNVLYSQNGFDITNDVVTKLNERYNSGKKSE